jgi:hypothetical protein
LKKKILDILFLTLFSVHFSTLLYTGKEEFES